MVDKVDFGRAYIVATGTDHSCVQLEIWLTRFSVKNRVPGFCFYIQISPKETSAGSSVNIKDRNCFLVVV